MIGENRTCASTRTRGQLPSFLRLVRADSFFHFTPYLTLKPPASKARPGRFALTSDRLYFAYALSM